MCRESSLVSFPLHELRPKRAFGFVLIVRAAAQPDSGYRCPSPPRKGPDMIEFEKSGRLAAITFPANESALAVVPLPNGTSDVRRDMTGATTGRPDLRLVLSGCAPPTPPAADRTDLPPLEFLDEDIERSVDHLSHIPRGNSVAQQGLRVPQFVAGALRDGDLKEKTLRNRRTWDSDVFPLRQSGLCASKRKLIASSSRDELLKLASRC